MRPNALLYSTASLLTLHIDSLPLLVGLWQGWPIGNWAGWPLLFCARLLLPHWPHPACQPPVGARQCQVNMMAAATAARVVLVLALVHQAAPHGDGPAERKRRGDSYFLDGQFDGFVPAAGGGLAEPQQATMTPSIRINTTAPLHAGFSCDTPDLGPHGPLHPYACGENGAWVEVSGQCATSSGTWWAGLFPASAPADMHTINPNDLAGNNTNSPWTPPFIVPAPLKFTSVKCYNNLSKGDGDDPLWRRWWVPNTRQPLVLILFNGSESSAHETARSDPITFGAESAAAPMHLRLARTHSPTEMRVSWTSSCSQLTGTAVKWGTDPKQLSHTVAATSATCKCARHPFVSTTPSTAACAARQRSSIGFSPNHPI